MNATDASMDSPHPLHERVELIVHLIKFSDRLFVIMSPRAEDLRIFADLLIKQGGAGLLIARVYPDLALNAEDVAHELAKAWGIELNLGESAMQAIEQRLPELLPEPRRAVAIIEDVERLPPHALDELIGFMQHLDGQTSGRVRLALLGGPHLAGQLQHMQSLKAGGQVYALHLAPPPVGAFAGMATSVSGDPTLAHSLDKAVAGSGGHTSRMTALWPLSGLYLIGGIAAPVTLAVVIALLLQPGGPEVKKDWQVSVPLKNETVANLPVAPLPTPTPGAVSGQLLPSLAPTPIGHQLTDSVTDAGKANTTLPPLLAAPTSTPKPAAPTPIDHQLTDSVTDAGKANATLPPLLAAPTSTPKPAPPTPAEAKPSAPVPTAEPKPSAPAARPAAEPKPSLAAPKPAAQPAKKAGNWYAQQKGEQYVLQVVSLKSEAEVNRFIKQNGLKDCHSFRQLRDGQTLHTLTCGLYSSRNAASQASAKLPEKARAGKPFPRRIDDIRKIMLP